MVIPDPGIVVIEVVRRAADPGVTESDMIRWIGVTVAVAGAVLATPDGISSAWLSVKGWHRRAGALARRMFRRRDQIVGVAMSASGKMGMSGTAYAERWQPWREDAEDDERIGILHQQIDILHHQVGELRSSIDHAAGDLRKEVREAESRVMVQLRQLASELRGERSQASRVDARGIGPITLGIILTGVPDELATVAAVGWLAVVVSVLWIAAVSPSWLRDYKQALQSNKGL